MNTKIRIYYLTLLMAISLLGTAQNLSRDSLEIEINRLEMLSSSLDVDSTLAFYYNDMCEKCIFSGDNRAEEFLKRFENKYKLLSKNWKPAEALFYRAKGKYLEKKGDYKKAIELYLDAIKILESNVCDPKHLTYSYIMAGFVLTNNHNTEECIKLFKKAEPLALREKNKANIIWIYDYFGDVEYDKAKNKKDFEKALFYYKKVEQFIPETNIRNQKANNLEGLGKTYWKLGNKKLAYEYFNKALSEANKKKEGEGFNLWNIYSQLSYFNNEENKVEEAIVNAKKGLDAAEYHGYAEFILRSHQDLYQFYKKNGDTRNALLSFEKYVVLHDSLGRNELNAKYKELEGKYKYEIQENKIKELQTQKLQLIGYSIGSALLLGLLALVYYIYTNKKLKNKNHELTLKNNEIENALFKGEQQERKRIASDLHDGLSTKISALKWRLEAVEDDQKANAFDDFVLQLENLYTDVRLISHNLAPIDLDKKGFRQSIEVLFSKLNLLDKTTFFIRETVDESMLSLDLKFQLYCIILELSNNVLKHSNANNAIFRMSINDELLIVLFEDDGNLQKEKKVGMGIKNIKSRIQDLGGVLKISDNIGYKVTMTIPLK